jgi:tetratricopeptide (TPR) repeat protein/tRNA A-37 threonylcarbamoyl transferase component Bud32
MADRESPAPAAEAADSTALRRMEGCIAAMKHQRSAPADADRGNSSAEDGRAGPEDDPLAAAPWHALDRDGEIVRPLQRGDLIGRYVVLDELGRGAMGIVHAAFDPELDRKIAIKLLPTRRSYHDREHARRLAREARALARLAHPNVVAVHDVGLVPATAGSPAGDPTVFVAMEHVDGTTLRGWLAAAPRSRREVLAMLEQAGRGLAAAHEMGLVHRDFKPDNVMVGNDGRARVMDFGLARSLAAAPSSVASTAPATEGDAHTTKTGTIAGTPAYMAPEQHQGHADARSDQFSFCVTAWEALHGHRPFQGKDLRELATAVSTGRFAPRRPDEPLVPEWLRTVLRRGLAVEPARRYPSMSALLAALADDPSRRRRRWLGATAMVGLLGLGGAALAWDRHERARACEAAGAAIDDVWNDDARAAVEAALHATGVPYAEDTRAWLVADLDEYAARWAEVRESTCRASELEGTHDDALAARADACLDERRDVLAAWAEVLPSTDETTIAQLTTVTTDLPAIEPCADASWLARGPTPPEDTALRHAASSLQRRLARARSFAVLGRLDEALALARAVEGEAEALGAMPLVSRAALTVADATKNRGDDPEPAYERAIAAAIAASDDALAIRALVASALQDVKAGRQERAQSRLAFARALLARAEPERGEAAIWVLNGEGALAMAGGKLAVSLAAYTEALALAEQALPHGHPSISSLLTNLANVQHRLGDYAASLASFGQVVAMREQVLGPEHPLVVAAYANFGASLAAAGEGERAEPILLHTIALAERVLGPDHVTIGQAATNLGLARTYLGRAREGAADLERAAEVLERARGADHPDLMRTLVGLGTAYIAMGAAGRAVPVLERALAARERHLGPAHAEVALVLDELAVAELALGRLDEAEAKARRALAIRAAALPRDHPEHGHGHDSLAHVLAARGDVDGALEQLRREIEIYERNDDPLNAGTARANLARLHVAAGRLHEGEAVYRALRTAAQQHESAITEANALEGLSLIHELRGQPAASLAASSEALALGQRALEPDAPWLARPHLAIAVAEHALGRRASAVAHAERALALRSAASQGPGWRAEAELVLARILADDPGAHARAARLRAQACPATRSAFVVRLRACDEAP